MMRLQNVRACCFQIGQVGENPKGMCFLDVLYKFWKLLSAGWNILYLAALRLSDLLVP